MSSKMQILVNRSARTEALVIQVLPKSKEEEEG